MDSSGVCPRYFNSCGESMQSKLDSPMPWIGMYVAAASAVISIAMAADVIYGFKNKKLWLPSKYFSMNAFSLTILAVAMKLPVDLTNQMLGVDEILARVSSLALMSTVMGNLLTSLGTLENNEVMLNLAALGTLVITIIVNVCIHISQMLENVGKEFRNTVMSEIYAEQIVCTVIMFVLLVMLCFWGVQVPFLRENVDKTYNQLRKRSSIKLVKWGAFTIEGLKAVLRDYWVLVRIGNPQFLIARSEICAASGAMCLLTALTLLKAWVRMHFLYKGVNGAASNYKWSVSWILIIQSMGVGLGTIAPMFRWFLAAKFKSSNIRKCFTESLEFTVLGMNEQLVRHLSLLTLEFARSKFEKFVVTTKVLVIFTCFIVQYVIVVACRLLLLVSAACVKVILFCVRQDESIEEIDGACDLLLNDGFLIERSVESISCEVDKLIEIGRKKQPEDLIELLKKSVDFNGVKEYVNRPTFRPDEALNCWSLTIVILTGIAVQLPNITTNKTDELLRGVSEGLDFVNHIEKFLNVNLERYTFRLQANRLWRDVQQQQYWCSDIYVKRRSYEETLQALSKIAAGETIVAKPEELDPRSQDFASDLDTVIHETIRYISSAIVESTREHAEETEEHLFERISVMISDLVSACLTNLVPLITFKCSSSAIKEREKNVREAAILLGQAEVILEMLRQRKLPGLDPEKAAHISEWRVFMEQNTNWMERDSENRAASVSAATTATIPQSNEEQVIVIE